MKRQLCFLSKFTSALAFYCVVASSARAQVQQAWVARYNNGITNGQHEALKMAIDVTGNAYVCGFSQNINSNLDYAVLKYAPNGNLLWAARLDSTNTPQAKPSGFALDPGNNTVVTGNAGTVKVDALGAMPWTAPYAGLAVATDTNSNVFVTGFGASFNTVKLDPAGQELWMQTYTDVGTTLGESLATDPSGNVYVAGLDVWFQERSVSDQCMLLVKYNGTGTELWQFQDQKGAFEYVYRVPGLCLDQSGNAFVLFDANNAVDFAVDKLDPAGNQVWGAAGLTGGADGSVSHGLGLGCCGQIACTGMQTVYPSYDCYGSYGLSSNGTRIWSNGYPSFTTTTISGANAIASNDGGTYITGYSRDANTGNDIVTIAYDTNGKQLWLQRYDGPAHGDDEGNAICVDTNGNVYVAGYDTPIGGGTEMVLIKYSPITVKHEANGDFQLEAQGAPSEPFDIQASTNLDTWLDLGDFDADTNGVLQFTDTNAGQFPTRFYLALPQ